MHDPYDRHRRTTSPDRDSDATIEMPRRFDEEGNRRSTDDGGSLARSLQDLFAPNRGSGGPASFFKSLAGSLRGKDGSRDEQDGADVGAGNHKKRSTRRD